MAHNHIWFFCIFEHPTGRFLSAHDLEKLPKKRGKKSCSKSNKLPKTHWLCSALPSWWCRVGARPNQKMDGGYIQCEFPRTLVPIQHSEMSVIWAGMPILWTGHLFTSSMVDQNISNGLSFSFSREERVSCDFDFFLRYFIRGHSITTWTQWEGRGSKNVCFCPLSGYKNCPCRKGGGVKKWNWCLNFFGVKIY